MTHLILAGVSGTGARTVGRLLAERLCCPFIDGEAEVEAALPKALVRQRAAGDDSAIHEIEARVLKSLLRQSESAVLALGGSALAAPETCEMVKHAGPLIRLTAEQPVLSHALAVSAGQRSSVKVAEPLANIRELLERHSSEQAQADCEVDTTDMEPVAVVEEVLQWLQRVRVELAERSYDLHIEEGCHAWLGPLLAAWPDPVSAAIIISNRQVDRHYGDTLRESLQRANIPHHTLLVPAGERYKSLQAATRLYGDLIQRKADRKSVIVALGGGVIGDLAGFVAATYMRGVRFVQVPTTLLAQVDSSIGGKVGVNHPLGKNMVGAFLQPQVVLMDPLALRTLPPRELRSGLSEIVKYGMIADADLFAFLENHVDAIFRQDAQTIKHLIRRSCQLKAHIVEQDETEAGLRAILNFGHTTAHAVETYTSYERYTHGEAVAIGMVVAARIAHAMGLLRAEPVHRLTRLLERLELPAHLPKADPGVLMSLMDSDKKSVAGKVRFVLPTDIGHAEVVEEVSRDILRRAMKESLEL